VAAVAALLVLSACGTSAGGGVATAGGAANPVDGDTDTGDGEQLDADAQALVFAECLRDNGIDMPDPGPGQQGLMDTFQSVAENYTRATLEKAFVACEDSIPQFEHDGMDRSDDETRLALAECLREQGLDVSDQPMQDAHSLDENEFRAAMEVCRGVLTGGGQ
jgi:hypothetical protein